MIRRSRITDKAIALDPKLANAYNHRGFLYAAQGKVEQALKDYNQAISLDPKLRDAFINREIFICAKSI